MTKNLSQTIKMLEQKGARLVFDERGDISEVFTSEAEFDQNDATLLSHLTALTNLALTYCTLNFRLASLLENLNELRVLSLFQSTISDVSLAGGRELKSSKVWI